MNKKGIVPLLLILDIVSFVLILGGSLMTRFDPDPKISTIGGILAGIGIGLLSLSRLIK